MMTSAAVAATGSQGLWFVSRGSGLVLLVLFSVVMVLGAATRMGSAPRRWPRFAVAELHRTLSLFAVALLGLHVVTAILDPFVRIGWAATLLPFGSPYRTAAIGLGTLAVDLGGAVLLTSLARRPLGFRAWRAVHWLAYLAWPVAFVHSLTAGNDLHLWWVALIECGSAALVATAVLARLLGRARTPPPSQPGHAVARKPHVRVGAMKRELHTDAPDGWSPPGERASGPAGLPRLLPARYGGGPATLGDHLARHGPLPRCAKDPRRRDALITEVARAGLTGRGGASFPTARKLTAVASGPRRPIVIANGTEGEPASAKDKVLLAREPHLVLDGAVLAAEMVGAGRAVVVVHHAVREIVDDAVAKRRSARLDRIALRVMTAADRFVAGEASAAVHWVERGDPRPTRTPPRLSEHGLGGRPTLVQNVETLAHLALIARYGAHWFRSAGTPAEPGSMLVTLIGAVRRPGVYEIEIGTPAGQVLGLAGGPAAPLAALLLGGYFGTWVPWRAAAALPLSAAGLAVLGAGPGAGLVAALPDDACGLAETARVARYLADESAGQCGPCVFGLDAVAGQLEALARGRGGDLGRLRRALAQADGRGACRHPDGAVRMVRSALAVFSDEIDRHAGGWCRGTSAAGLLPVPPRAPR